jgi:lipopolysaccharide/colanic/teichoic acid biosynthesis glycosyltransferase
MPNPKPNLLIIHTTSVHLNPDNSTHINKKRSAFLPGWLTQFFSFLTSTLLGIVLWRFLGLLWKAEVNSQIFIFFGIFVFGIGFSAFLTLGLLRVDRLPAALAYRISFIVGLSLTTGRWVSLGLSADYSIQFFPFILLILSHFAGGLVVSGIRYGIVENTFPPSEELKQEVKRKYLDYNQTPPRIFLSKRIFDFIVAFVGTILSSPIWVMISLLIWLQDPGPIFFIKNSVGYRGDNFRLLKFRTMKKDAEKETGPISSNESDQRIHRIGQFLRKTALDELPQLVNILRGEMSFVGPRPTRTVVVVENLKEIPDYAARYDVLPGLSGLAQIAGDYHLPSRDKLRYERIYANHSNLGFDIKLIFLAFVLVFWLRWKKDWDGQVPRAWIKWGHKPHRDKK